jgi:hypothetical protein
LNHTPHEELQCLSLLQNHAGSNRTGSVICCYLIECPSPSPTAALQSYASSREGGIKHEEFREELLARYTIAAEIAPIQEFNPAWHS